MKQSDIKKIVLKPIELFDVQHTTVSYFQYLMPYYQIGVIIKFDE